MAKKRNQDLPGAADQPSRQKALLFELKGKRGGDSNAVVCTEVFAALSIEEVIRYVRTHRPNLEISEVKPLGEIQVLSTSDCL